MTRNWSDKVITNPVEAHIEVSKQYGDLHEELLQVYKDLDWYRHGLEFISKMPTTAGQVATLCLQKRPYKG